MPIRSIQGGEALALGALAAGVRSATSYPGSPSSEVIEALIDLARDHDLRVEWSSNERVALEIAHRGLDRRPSRPGLHQERRHERHARPAHGPEPDAGPRRAGHRPGRRPRRLRLAERSGHPAAGDAPGDADARALHAGRGVPDDGRGVRPLRAVPDARHRPRDPELRPVFGDGRTPRGIPPAPGSGHRSASPGGSCPSRPTSWRSTGRLHDRLGAFAAWAETSPYLESSGSGDLGVIAAGFAARKLDDVLGDPPPEGLRVVPARSAPPAARRGDRPMARGVSGGPGRRGDRAVPGTRDPGDRAQATRPGPASWGKATRAPPARGRAVPLADPRGAPRLAAGPRAGRRCTGPRTRRRSGPPARASARVPLRRGPRRDRRGRPVAGVPAVPGRRPGLPRDRRRPARREVRDRLGDRRRPRPDPGRGLRPGRRPVRRLRVLPLRHPGPVPRGRGPEPRS